ncbi:MAG: cation diffusion facilitator family transporter [Desulfarculaceae bacterium]|nr:cation diffusion facilitator family transporter [Desulfarculaceae bacterium]MCF8070782.1 cation diffusion facilitator family transporter [Desulfarculaceae bacterium]MCF8102219.1 cation diffusion facilitator family transporter [Desulfarculaceae bacterium]MCF8116982.1 cation diffusion facilitator family transporter [Desulfarculaceae bacterium]
MTSSSKFIIHAALAGNLLVAVTKFVAAYFTRSSAMISEGIHSLVDTGNQVLLLWGLKQAERPPEPDFPFGHGKEVYFWSFVVAVLIFAVGAGVSLYEGVLHILEPAPIENILVNYIVLVCAMVFEGFAWFFAMRQLKQTKGDNGYFQAVRKGKDPTLFVVVFEDSAAMLGLLVALAGNLLYELTGNPYFDGGASIVIGLLLGATAIWLAYETKGLLIGERAARHVISGITAVLAAHPVVSHVNEVLTMHLGPEDILANISVDFDDAANGAQIEKALAELEAGITARHPEVKKIYIKGQARPLPA